MTDGERDLVGLGKLVQEARGTEKAKPFARRAGISPELLWQIEHAQRRDGRPWNGPTAPNVQAVARAAGIDERLALEMAGYDPDHYITPVDNGPPLMSETVLAGKIRDLRVPERRALEVLVDSLLVAKGYIAPVDGAAAPPAVAARPAVLSHEGQRTHGGVEDAGSEYVPDPVPSRVDQTQR